MSTKRSLLIAASALGMLELGGCESFPIFSTHNAPLNQTAEQVASTAPSTGSVRENPRYQKPELLTLPKAIAPPAAPQEQEATFEEIRALVGTGTVSATLPPQPVPQFLDTAFGAVLKVPYSMGPNVANRTEIISVGGATNLSRADFFRLLQTALRTYALKLYIRGNSVAVLDSNAPSGQATEMLRSRSEADTPIDARTVIQFYQLATLEASAVLPLMQDILPPGRTVKVVADPLSNTLILTGSGRDVAAAVDALRNFDKPIFAGAKVARFQPAFWSAEGFAKALRDALTAEGYKLADTLMLPRTIVILPMAANSQVLVFTSDQTMMDRVLFWAEQIDRPSTIGDQKTTFIYSVRNTDATSLGHLLTGAGSAPTQPNVQPPVGVPGTPPATSANAATANTVGVQGATVASGGTISIDAIGNRILFTGTATQFAQTRALLEQLDTPPAQVLVEVTIAEVTLTDSSQAGLEWFFSHTASNGGTVSGGTQGGLSIGTGGLSLTYATCKLVPISRSSPRRRPPQCKRRGRPAFYSRCLIGKPASS
jgi:general secretion pathway protein D